jgi:hypothetical protein
MIPSEKGILVINFQATNLVHDSFADHSCTSVWNVILQTEFTQVLVLQKMKFLFKALVLLVLHKMLGCGRVKIMR